MQRSQPLCLFSSLFQLSTLSEADAAFYKQYGRLPKPKPLIKQPKKDFDSADWAQKKQQGELGGEEATTTATTTPGAEPVVGRISAPKVTGGPKIMRSAPAPSGKRAFVTTGKS
eukprot:TRINITY_DN3453_c0_g1_i3.p1 TRINITY_DN3453_c0_g1~~TRINITY_DN3453_c0_g1_i3.p1  ORF type:complete len:130 (+),score=23.26 TRINITY_DN3453_c0_g1_i3:51-392(+)